MDGNLPEEDTQPISSDHPNSIFSLFGKTHRMNVSRRPPRSARADLCKDERLDESYGSRMSSMTEDLGLVWLHVVSPPDIESDLASVSENWGNFGGGGRRGGGGRSRARREPARRTHRANLNGGRPIRFEDWIDRIEPGRRPALNFKHTLLPHVPWQYLPSGAATGACPTTSIPGSRTSPSRTRASSTCCSSATSCRRGSPTSSCSACGRS